MRSNSFMKAMNTHHYWTIWLCIYVIYWEQSDGHVWTS